MKVTVYGVILFIILDRVREGYYKPCYIFFLLSVPHWGPELVSQLEYFPFISVMVTGHNLGFLFTIITE